MGFSAKSTKRDDRRRLPVHEHDLVPGVLEHVDVRQPRSSFWRCRISGQTLLPQFHCAADLLSTADVLSRRGHQPPPNLVDYAARKLARDRARSHWLEFQQLVNLFGLFPLAFVERRL